MNNDDDTDDIDNNDDENSNNDNDNNNGNHNSNDNSSDAHKYYFPSFEQMQRVSTILLSILIHFVYLMTTHMRRDITWININRYYVVGIMILFMDVFAILVRYLNACMYTCTSLWFTSN